MHRGVSFHGFTCRDEPHTPKIAPSADIHPWHDIPDLLHMRSHGVRKLQASDVLWMDLGAGRERYLRAAPKLHDDGLIAEISETAESWERFVDGLL